MNSNFSAYDNNERSSADKMDVDQTNNTVHMPAPAGTGRETERGEAEMAPPGPASSKIRYGTRSRSGSASSGSSYVSGASTATGMEGKNRREAAQEANRLAATLAKERGGREQSPIYVDSEDSEDGSRSSGRGEHPLKRKIADAEDSGELPKTRRKQGRPQTTGLYVKRAEAIEEANKKEREAAELEADKIARSLSTGQLFKKVERNLEEAVEELENAPTADVANQARKCMAEVLRVAKTSRNLQGGYVKILKQAAVVGAATAEVLRTRADCCSEPESDAFRQIKALRNELEGVKREAQTAREEAEALRKELAEEREKGGRRSRRRIVTDDSSPSPPKGKRAEYKARKTGDSVEPPTGEEEVSPMEIGMA